jgi:HD superfamily phosphohydrolase
MTRRQTKQLPELSPLIEFPVALKVVKDTIHGYISIPAPIFENFIDTQVFQRLRGIEQTSMRGLYPCARHDRFSHSLGVYHLGCRAFSELIRNNNSILNDTIGADLQRYRDSFEIACLLHDCGHAPFSHTCEGYFPSHPNIKKELNALVNNSRFESDLNPIMPAKHELTSAYVAWQIFQEPLSRIADPEFVIRCILGCTYRGEGRTDREFVLNCIIEMLNGRSFDVDKLDYTLRDTWASGVRNSTIDSARLLSGLRICRSTDSFRLCFDKSCVSVVKSLLQANDYLYKWIYSHHKVKYESKLISDSVEELGHTLDSRDDSVLSRIFSLESFLNAVPVGVESFLLPMDGDFLYLFKKHSIHKAEELLTRQHRFFAVWKTFAEYNALFRGVDAEAKELMKKEVALGALDKELGITQPDMKCRYDLEVKHGAKVISPTEVYFAFDKEPLAYDQVLPGEEFFTSPSYWILYVHRDFLAKKQEIRKYLAESFV